MTITEFASALILSNFLMFAICHQGTNRRIRKALRRKTEGAFVEVHLHYGFLRIEEAKTGEKPFCPCLHITDLNAKSAASALNGKWFDWGAIHSHWLRSLEIDGLLQAEWEDVQKYLKAE